MVYVIMFLVCFTYVGYMVYAEQKRTKADKAENKSGSTDYIYKRNENPNVIGGTNLDRFFVECVLSNCNDFSAEKNIAKAKILADKYNLTYSSGIEKLYEQAFEAHKGISTAIKNEKLAEQRAEEREEYNTLVKYAEYYGREKKQAMLTDRMEELRKKAKLQDEGAKMLLRSGQQKELDWAILGGAANGIGGVGAGLATAMDVQAKNAQIRAQNEANRRAAMPGYMAVTGSAAQNRSNANAIEKQIAGLNEKLISEAPTSEVMELLDIVNPTVDVSETGAYRITATVKPKKELFIFDDVSAVADGTIEAHVLDGTCEIGTAKMVFPVNGVSGEVGIIGMGVSGAEPGKTYHVTFTGYKLWLMEK